MGACFSKVFNGCPLHINCTASWINPETRDQHILIGADEGIFNLNMNEIHDAVIDQLYARRTVWLYVIKDVLMSLSGMNFFFSDLDLDLIIDFFLQENLVNYIVTIWLPFIPSKRRVVSLFTCTCNGYRRNLCHESSRSPRRCPTPRAVRSAA
jgi:CNH domain